MACEAFEDRILDYLENQLPAAERARVETHLGGCGECRAFARQLERLDAQLSRTLKPRALSPSFNARLRQRIQTMPLMTAVEIAERKRQLQSEYDADLAKLRLFSLRRRGLLHAIPYTAALVITAWLAWLYLPELADLAARFASPGLNQDLLMALTAGAVFAAIGLVTAFPRQVMRMMRLH
jgi:anti-sigma factor RsiW